MTGSAEAAERAAEGGAGHPAGPRRWLVRTWGSRNGRRMIMAALGVVLIVLVLGVGYAMFSSLSGESPSYKDGFSAGATVLASDGTGASPEQACRMASLHGGTVIGLPTGDDPAQWVKGCVAAFESAQNDN